MRSQASRSKSMKDLLRLRRKALQGNKRAQQALVNRNRKMAQRVNRMLDILAKRGFTQYAYKSAQAFLHTAYKDEGVTRFKTDLTDHRAIYQQAIAMEHFLSLKTSTLTGTKQAENDRVAGFRARFSKYTKGMSKRQILDFFDFLSNESVDAYLEEAGKYQSGEEVDSFLIAMNEVGRDGDEIIEMIEKYNETLNSPSPNEDERFYYDDLVKWLRGGIDVEFEGKKVHITKRG